jgi:hypothetical protein
VIRIVRSPWGPAEKKTVLLGLVGAVIAHLFWPLRAALLTLKTLFHEIGHAVAGWLFGYPAIPAFDFIFGGGMTHYNNFQPFLALLVAVAFAYAAWRFRENTPVVTAIAVIFLLWLVIVTKEWRRETVLASAGVAFELILGAIFLYMALSGRGWRRPEIERPLGAMVAFFVQLYSWIFAFQLIRDVDFREWYREGKGGALMNDLEVVALNLKIYLGMNTSIEGVAKMLVLFSLIPPAVAIYWWWNHTEPESQ